MESKMSLADQSDEIPDDLAPSALYILRGLVDADEPMTTAQLEHDTLLPKRTIRYGLDRLRSDSLVETQPSPSDPRREHHIALLGR